MKRSSYRFGCSRLQLYLIVCLILSACTPSGDGTPPFLRATSTPPFSRPGTITPVPQSTGVEPTLPFFATVLPTGVVIPTPLATRPSFKPAELVDYIVQTGDTLPALAVHFNTTVKEIRSANPIIPVDVTTLPPGMPMKIPIYYRALWGSSYQILPDSLYVNGPAQSGFDTVAFVDSQPGWLRNYEDFVSGSTRRGGDMVQAVANNYSISPRLLLAIIEYQTGALSQSEQPDDLNYLLGFRDKMRPRLGQQLGSAADLLNQSYYDWRKGSQSIIEHLDGRLEYPDPWQNAATVALQHYYARLLVGDGYTLATQGKGLAQTYRNLFGDPWQDVQPHIPGSLKQPALRLPFLPGKAWTLTGGPHTSWGSGEPWGALDFAPPGVQGCGDSTEWTTALADGVVARSDPAVVMLDLDGDGDERTGWVVLYLHLAKLDQVIVGTRLNSGDGIGHPSCEGGTATGTHVHVALKYNGEWIIADSALPFNMEGWIPVDGPYAYGGKLVRFSQVVVASNVSDRISMIASEYP
jgi:LasA protease